MIAFQVYNVGMNNRCSCNEVEPRVCERYRIGIGPTYFHLSPWIPVQWQKPYLHFTYVVCWNTKILDICLRGLRQDEAVSVVYCDGRSSLSFLHKHNVASRAGIYRSQEWPYLCRWSNRINDQGLRRLEQQYRFEKRLHLKEMSDRRSYIQFILRTLPASSPMLHFVTFRHLEARFIT